MPFTMNTILVEMNREYNTFCPTAETKNPDTCVIAVIGPFCSFA